MGTISSRLGDSVPPASHSRHIIHSSSRRRYSRRSSFKRTVSSILLCGTGSSFRPQSDEVEDDPPEILLNTAEDCNLDKIQFLAKNSALSTGGTQYSSLRTGTRVLSEPTSRNSSMEGNSISGNKGESFSRDLESSPQLIATDKASSSRGDESSPESAMSANDRPIMDAVNSRNGITNESVTPNHPGIEQYFPSSDCLQESPEEASVENFEREMLVFHDCDSAPASVLSDSSTDNITQTSSPGFRFPVSEREQSHRNRNILQVDMGSVSNTPPSAGSSDLRDTEGRQNSRRLFWDAFSHRSSRRNADSRTFVATNDDTDGLGSHDRGLPDFSNDLFDDGVGGGSRHYSNNNQMINSQLLERFRNYGQSRSGRRTATCALDIHPDGTCACRSTLRAEDSGTRARISRIVMLAEALFEVLDEIHRQPMSVSLSMASHPAPESVVDSLPTKYFRKPEKPESEENVQQCYICLAEYDEGDKIRVLPCHHEFHVLCVDKWLKEIHSVCPLCRGNVRDGCKEGSSISDSGANSPH